MAISTIDSTGLASAAVTPTNLSTGAPSWDSSGNLSFNSGYGSVATAYGCRAWVNFNGTGTVAIRGSGNVTSITDNGTGDYTINFTNAMPDVNYGFAAMLGQTGGSGYARVSTLAAPTTSAIRIDTLAGNAYANLDIAWIGVVIFR